MSDEVIARVSPSTFRVFLGVAAMSGLGGFLLYLALAHPPASLPLRGFLVVMGLLALWAGARMFSVNGLSLELTETHLKDSEGRIVATIAEVESVDRGAFAFKPSHGFLLRLSQPAPRAWFPGIWWRMGRRVAIGGVLPGGENKAIADMISIAVARRKGDLPL